MTQLNESKQLILDTYNHFINITKPLSELTPLAYLMLLDGLSINYGICNSKGNISFLLSLNNLHKYTIKEISNFLINNIKNSVKYIFAYLTFDNLKNIIVELNYSDTFKNPNGEIELNVSFTAYNKKTKLRYDVINSFIVALYIFNRKDKNITIDELMIELADTDKLKQKLKDRLEWSFKEEIKQELENSRFLQDLQELNELSENKRDDTAIKLQQEYFKRLKSKVKYEFEKRNINNKIDSIISELKIDEIKKYCIDKGLITVHDISIKKLDKNPFIKRLKQHCIRRGWIDNNYNLLEHDVVWLEKRLLKIANGKRCAICGDIIISSKENAVVCNKCKIKGKRKKEMLRKYFDNLTGKWLMSKDEIIADMKRRSESTGSKGTIKDWNTLVSSLMETIEMEGEQD